MGVITVDTLNRRPIYEQLIDNIRQNVLRGTLSPGEQLPSVRSLAGELAINPNTIQKAYVELEREGIISSLPGRGSFISNDIGELARINRVKLTAEVRSCLSKAFEAGIAKSDMEQIVSEIWNL